MSDIFEEVKEDLQYERALGFWQTYQNYIINGGVAILLTVGAYEGWQYYQAGKNVERAKIYYVAAFEADTMRTKDALQQLKGLADSGSSTYTDLARLKAAGILTDKKKIAEAVELYQSVQQKNWSGDVYKDFATINGAYLALDAATDDGFLKPLEPLCKEGHAWRGSALELKGLYHIKQKNWTEALKTFDTLQKDPALADNIKIRAHQLHVYALEQKQQS